MRILIRSDAVVIEGYVNAVERNSKPLTERGVTFVERIKAGAFRRAIERAKDIRIWLNHKEDRDLGGIADGNLQLEEDAIGLKARAVITDPEVIEDARRGNLVGWSFGFKDIDNGVSQLRDEETGLPLRLVRDMILSEVSLLNRQRSPAYVGTLVNVRADGTEERSYISAEYCEKIETVEEPAENTETRSEETVEEPTPEVVEPVEAETPSEPVKEVSSVYYARYKNMIAEMRRA